MANIFFLVIQLKQVVFPDENSNQQRINIAYTVITFLIFINLALSFRKEYGIKFSYLSIIALLIRVPIRLLDFENMRPNIDDSEWNLLVVNCVSS